MPACNPIHSPLLIIAFHSNSSSGCKWPICQEAQLQLNRVGGRHAHLGPNWERTCCWQPPGQAQCPRLCKPHGIFSRSLVTQHERGLKVPSEPRSLGLSFLLCRERPSPCGYWEARGPVSHPSTCVSSLGSIWSPVLSPNWLTPGWGKSALRGDM